MKACIFIGSEWQGFLISLGAALEKKHNISVKFVGRDQGVMDLIKHHFPGRVGDIDLSKYLIPSLEKNEILNSALKIERKYNTKLSYLISEDRALGRGYLFNVDKYPEIIRSSWSNEKKIGEIVKQFQIYESILEDCDISFRTWPRKIPNMILRKNGGTPFSLMSIQFGTRYFWTDEDYISSSKYRDRVKENLNAKHLKSLDDTPYEIDFGGSIVNKNASFTYFSSIKAAVYTLATELFSLLKRTRKKNSYRIFGWVPSIFRKVNNFRLVSRLSMSLQDLKEQKYVLFLMHSEPEVALQFFSPEFNNSMELISMVSKTLPADHILILKEQVLTFGVRSAKYYKTINSIGNVSWISPKTHSWDLIKNAESIISFTGTVGIEAVHFKKPVITFGKHQIINHLPTVWYVSNYDELLNAMNHVLSLKSKEEDFERSKNALLKAQLETSIDLKDYYNSVYKTELEFTIPEKALSKLIEDFPEVFKECNVNS